MDKLDQYLDQVCRGIAGPRALRQHLRQELQEHLRDAVARYRDAGLGETDAVERALDDFGQPDEVRAGLAETHGQRLMAVVLDKALEWKETTMKAKWLWLSWSYGMLGGLIGLQVLFLTMSTLFFTPKVYKILQDVRPANDDPSIASSVSFLRGLDAVGDHATWCLLGAIALAALFEWRVRGENKSLIRLSALGSIAMGLGVACVFTAAATAVPLMLTFPAALAGRG